MNGWIEPLTLESESVRLEPLTARHAKDLASATQDGKLWQLWFTQIPAPESVVEYIAKAQAQCEAGTAVAFAVRDKATGAVVGSTRYCHIDADNQRVEIGYTWYAHSAQRTGINTECKFLLLEHAFESRGAIAVEFRTHWHNRASRAAIERLGAKCDGVLRNHQRLPDGSLRDTVVFSIINGEWPSVRRALEYSRRDRAALE